MIDIINLRHEQPTAVFDIYVDSHTPVGNPFHMVSEAQRNYVCDAYELYFYNMVSSEGTTFNAYVKAMQQLYEEYGQLRLFCSCAPKRCHAETIRDYIIREVKRK